jgi:ketosteroid isomerase-like protein
MAAVEQGAREEWIGLFASDATLEDPVDGTPGRTGTAEIAEFWDSGIAMFESVQFNVHRVHEAPGEALVLADVSVRVPAGAGARYDAVVHYRIDGGGRIESLRAFWDLPAMLAQLSIE